MNHISHCRQTSLEQQVIQYENKLDEAQQLVFIKSQKESPQSSPLFWLRSTQHSNEKCDSDQKINLNTKRRRLAYETKKFEQNISTHHNAKTRPLQKYLNICLQSALYIVQTAIKECSVYHNRFGSSYFNMKNCYVNQEHKLIISSSNNLGNAYASISDQTIVVRDIIQSVHKICTSKCFDDFYSYYKRSSLKSKCDFKYTLSLIKSYCKCSKISVADCIKMDNNNDIQKNVRPQHPKSAQRISHFNLLTNCAFRKNSSTKSNRESFYIKLFNKSKQKGQFKIKQINKQLPSQINVIKIETQYNVIVNPTLDQQNEKKSQIKTSTVSTNFKSSLHHGDSLQVSTINPRNKFSGLSSRVSQNKQYFSFLPIDLDEVQSLGQSSEQQSQLPTRTFQTASDIQQQNIKRQNEERILAINNWTRKVQGLLSQQRDLKLSINQDNNKQNYQVQKKSLSPKKLIRTVGQPILSIPSQFYLRHS